MYSAVYMILKHESANDRLWPTAAVAASWFEVTDSPNKINSANGES